MKRLSLSVGLVLALSALAAAAIIGGRVMSTRPTASAEAERSMAQGPADRVAEFVHLRGEPDNPYGRPNSAGNNTFQSRNLFGFDEDPYIVLSTPIEVDVAATPLRAGRAVASHYIFFDPPALQSIVGTVDFDADIVAVITSTDNLRASDGLIHTGITYLTPALRGLEKGDAVTISGPRQIAFATTAGTPGDYVRVLTEVSAADVPEPDALALIAIGFTALGIVAWHWKRRK